MSTIVAVIRNGMVERIITDIPGATGFAIEYRDEAAPFVADVGVSQAAAPEIFDMIEGAKVLASMEQQQLTEKENVETETEAQENSQLDGNV